MFYTLTESPLDNLLIWGNGEAICGLHMSGQKYESSPNADWKRDDGLFTNAIEQLKAYFAGELTSFDLPLQPRGSVFQQRVWQALRNIPFGRTVTYRDIANDIGAPAAMRAVGAANGKNPIGIIVPCHRVIGSNGKLTGYAGGLNRKQWLLAHESRAFALT